MVRCSRDLLSGPAVLLFDLGLRLLTEVLRPAEMLGLLTEVLI